MARRRPPRPVERWLGVPLGGATGIGAPPVILAAVYAVAMILGTIALHQPASGGLSWADAAFAAISATTVTGLSTVELSERLTGWGLAAIWVMMQVGGLGLMTFAVLVLRAFGGTPDGTFLRADISAGSARGAARLAGPILLLAAGAQTVGTAVMAPSLIAQAGGADGIGWAAFQAASAFNNAGLTPFAGVAGRGPVVLWVTAALFVLGGLGFAVLANLWDVWRGRSRLHLHTRLLLWGTLWCVLAGWAGIAALEWRGALGEYGPAERAGFALFMSLTPRTAGFDPVGAETLEWPTRTLIMILMLVGAGATSTGGGIKVATTLLLAAALAARLRGRPVRAWGVTVPAASVRRVAWLVASALGVVAAGAIALALRGHDWQDAAFEAISAFATVGLSVGVTEAADWPSRAILCVLMFLGRIGPLTLAWMLAAGLIGPPEDEESRLPLQ